MKRAVITESGVAEWYETCFCPSPLQHERETQLDLYFTDLNTEVVEEFGEVRGESLWSHLALKAEV